jgi:hypothetical protein
MGDLLDARKAEAEAPSHAERLRMHSLRSSMAVHAESLYLYPLHKSRFESKPHFRLCVYGRRIYHVKS